VAAAIAAPSIRTTALLGAVPLGLAAIAVALAGTETTGLHLEQITDATPAGHAPAPHTEDERARPA
jgi:putative MFS transporter